MTFDIKLSADVDPSHLKMLFWGATGTRKTETGLRYFPHVLMLDVEGNAEHCTRMPEIPPFLYFPTKDATEILNIIDAVSAGKIKFPDGSQVETVIIDSVSVLWSVQTETAYKRGEARAKKYNKNVEDANPAQLDWVKAKRPLKRIQTQFNNSNIKYLILVAREKDLWENDKQGNLKVVGQTIDAIRNIEYEMNLSFHFSSRDGKWFAQATKTQGKLGEKFPKECILYDFPASTLLEYAGTFKAKPQNVAADDEEAEKIVEKELAVENRTMKKFIEYAKSKGIKSATEISAALKGHGFGEFNIDNWEAMICAIDDAAMNL